MPVQKVGIFAIILFVTCSLTSSAQIRVGVKAGSNFYDNYQVGRKYFVSRPNVGFHAGVYGDYLFSDKLSARAEALFSTRGLYLSEYVQGTRIDYERQSSYLDIPLSASYNVWKNLSVHAGLVPSLFIQEYRSITKDEDGYKVDQGDQFRSYDRWQLGALAGASYTFTVFNQTFEGGARYAMGLTRTNELIREVRASRDPKYMMVQLYIAYKVFEF